MVVADEPLKKVCVYAGMRCDRGRDDRTRRDGSDTFSCYATLLTACESGMQARPRAAVSKSRTGDGHGDRGIVEMTRHSRKIYVF